MEASDSEVCLRRASRFPQIARRNLALSKGDSSSPAGTLQLLNTQHKKKNLGLLGHKITNYVNSTQVRQTCLVPMKLVCSCAGLAPRF